MTADISDFEFELFFVLTTILINCKLLLSVYLGKKLIDKKKETGKFKLSFITAVFVFIVSLFVSRLLYMYFDFYLTKFDTSTYYLMPNVLIWKIALFIGSVGFAFVLFTVDKKVLKFKLKGILAYLTLGIALLILIWPVKSFQDFVFISGLGITIGLSGFVIFIIFLYIGIKVSSFRKPSFLIDIGFMIYAIGSLVINEFILTPLRAMFGSQIHSVLYLIYMILKITGLLILSYGFIEFGQASENVEENKIQRKENIIKDLGLDVLRPKKISQEEVKFYREQNVCLVCKKLLVGFTMNFICPNCKALYCEKCARALAQLENMCWSCEKPVDESKPVKKLELNKEDIIEKEDNRKSR